MGSVQAWCFYSPLAVLMGSLASSKLILRVCVWACMLEEGVLFFPCTDFAFPWKPLELLLKELL